MLNTTRTGLGKSVLRRWLLQPSIEAEVIEARFNAVECYARPDNIHISDSIQKVITVKNVPRLLENLVAGHVPVQQWQALAQVGHFSLKLVNETMRCTDKAWHFSSYERASVYVISLGILWEGKKLQFFRK